MVDDAEELAAWLRAAYGKQKIFVMGHSWGMVLGLSLAERRPDWLYAYIGVGQIIDMRAGEKVGYDWVLEQARAADDATAVKERKWSVHFGGPIGSRRPASASSGSRTPRT